MSALEAFPGELAIVRRGPGWALLVSSPQGAQAGQRVSGELFCRDRDVLQTIADAVAYSRRARGPLLPVAEMGRLYFDGIDIAHLRHPAAPGIFCEPDADTDAMRGTGSQPEREWAASLRSCRVCVHRAAALRVAR